MKMLYFLKEGNAFALFCNYQWYFSSPEPKAPGAYRMGLKPASMHPFTLLNMNNSETSRPIEWREHHWGEGKAA